MRGKITVFSLIIMVGSLFTAHAKTIQIINPGNNKDIQPAIVTALGTAADGDIIALPSGTFVFNKNVVITKFVSFKGAGIGKTILYRPKSITDNVLSGSTCDGMLKFNINKNTSSNIAITDITFKSKYPSLIVGDTGSLAADFGIKIINCV